MYFSSSAGGQHQTNSPRRTSGGGVNESTSPIRKQFSQYMSLFQPDQTPGRQSHSDKIRKHHLRSSSSNPVNRMEMLYGSSSVTGGGGGSVTSLSPFHTASSAGVNNLVAVGTKTKSLSLLIDRSGLNGTGSEANYNYKRGGTSSLDPRFSSSVSGSYNRDQSLERNSTKPRDYFTMGSRWDRASADRDYSLPYTGNARSLEREQQMRAQSFEGSSFYRDQETPSPAFFPNESSIPSRDSYALDLQAQIAELNKECAVLQQELDLAKEKLNSTMNSIKSFWSPELKKERLLRKEENLKYSTLSEQLKSVEIENRQHLTALMKLEQENRTMREACTNSSNTSSNMQTQQTPSSLLSSSSSFATHSTGTGVGESGPSTEIIILKKEREKNLKEMKLLRKTLDEMELRIETQQKTLNTRDETIKKLMDMFQQARAKGAFVGESSGSSSNEESSINKRLENDLCHAREDLKKLREEAEVRAHQLDGLRTQEKLLKDKLEGQKQELLRKESETSALQSRIETLQRHFNDHEKHITVLREQIISKEQQIKMLHSDVEMLQDRLKEREETMDKKVRQTTQLQSDKTRLNVEMSTLRDALDEANIKVTSQQRKLESMEESMKEKELQLNSTKIQLSSLQLDHTSSDKALESLQDMMADKDRQIEKLREQKEKLQRDMESEVKSTMGRSSDLKVKVTQLQDDVIALQENELMLREEVSRLKAELGTKDSLLSKLSFEENELQAVVEDLQCKLNKSKREAMEAWERNQSECERRLLAARDEVETCRQEVARARSELEKMAAAKSELESQLKEKSSRLNDLEAQILISKRDHDDGGEGAKGDEGKRRRSDDDVLVFKSILAEKDSRIEELESALKESIKITAQREVVMAEQQMKLEHTERLMETMHEELENSKSLLEEGREQLQKSNQQVKEKDDVLKEHFNDSKKQLSEVYEMKQEAILAAISEKDAHIALLEMAPNKRTENIQEVEKLSKEKLKLQQVLRELTQSRMKLLQARGHMRSSSASSLLHYATHRDAEDDGGPQY